MEFDEKKALAVINRFNLSEKTLRVWKNRGKIPDKYFNSGFKKRKPLPVSSAQHKYLVRVINNPFLRKKSFASPKVPYYDITDALREKPLYRIDAKQYNVLYGQIVKLSGQIREIAKKPYSEKNAEKLKLFLMENPYFVYTKLLKVADLESYTVWTSKSAYVTIKRDYEKVVHQLMLLMSDLKS